MIPDCNFYHTCYAIGEIKRPIFDAYSIPIISQKLALWYNFSCAPKLEIWPCSRFCFHPTTNAIYLLVSFFLGF